MLFERAVTFFMPNEMRSNPGHRRYHEFRGVISACLIAMPLVLLFPLVLNYIGKDYLGYMVNALLISSILVCCRFFAHYRLPMTITALVTYFIIYGWIKDSGLIYSSNVSILHMYLLGAIWTDKRFGWWVIFTNLAFFGFLYHHTLAAGQDPSLETVLGSPAYPLVMHGLITVFFGGFLAYLQFDQERDRVKIEQLQDRKISLLDLAVKKRTEQLSAMRENIATDFHDETGNMLSAITRQASLLSQQLEGQPKLQPLLESIIGNSRKLYSTSKDFLWHLNHDSDDPYELFSYLTEYGQVYYNQFDIAFSSQCHHPRPAQLAPSAALQLIYIFKEAMTNVVKHANAEEVVLTLSYRKNGINYSLRDNGSWKEPAASVNHFGLNNMSRRCAKNGFHLRLVREENFSEVNINIPIPDSQDQTSL